MNYSQPQYFRGAFVPTGTNVARKLLLCLAACLMAATFSACKDAATQALLKKSSSGKTQELLLVIDHDNYQGNTFHLIDSLFAREQDGLNQPEAMFDIANIPISSFENADMFRSHHNVIICDIKPENPNKVYRHVDRFAAPQIVYDFAATDPATLDSLLLRYAPRILDDLFATEYRRIEKVYTKDFHPEIMALIQKHFGFKVVIPSEYVIAPPVCGDFMWIRKETKDYSQNIFIQVEPYLNENQFTQEVMLNHLDTMMKRHVPGPADGSYIGTERRLPFHTKVTEMKGQYAVELRGNYRCFGDFYGGPFVTYAVLSPDRREVVLITGLLYSPRKDKRDLLMQVDGICRTLSFDTKSTTQQ